MLTNFKIKTSFKKILIRFVLPQGVAKISKAANVADEEKSEALRNYNGHLAGVKKERDYYVGQSLMPMGRYQGHETKTSSLGLMPVTVKH